IFSTIQRKLKGHLEYLSLPTLVLNSRIESRFLFSSEVQKRIQLLDHYVDRVNLAAPLTEGFRTYLTFEHCETSSPSGITDRIQKVYNALNSHIHKKEAVAALSSLSDRFSGSLLNKVTDLFNRTDLNDCKDYIGHIETLFVKLPAFLLLKAIQNSLRTISHDENTLQGPSIRVIEKSLARDPHGVLLMLRDLYFQNMPRFQECYSNLSTILEARHLCTELNLLQSSFPRSSHIIAKEIETLENQRFEAVRRSIKVGILANLAQRLATRKHSQNLKYFAKVLQKGKKNYASFEELKTSIDYDSIITALPCWIMSVEDVARIFPLQSGLFDYVIIDESSQCAIPSAIPLLYRAKRAIIVGDDKQLPNADVQYIDGNRNESLLREYKIPQIRFGRSFDCKENSLFDLCNVLAPSSIFLNEHFRSYPE
ncbi:MAG: AAA domain-containing protein, partial [Bacteroidota bacterium]